MGSGKSTAARLAAARLGAIVIRTDAVRKRLAGRPLRERAATAYGEGLYTAEMSRRTYAEALRLAGELLRAGWPVIADGAFSHAAERVEAPDEVLVDRLRGRSEDRHEVSDGREELLALHRARYETPAPEPDVIRLDTTGDSGRAVEAALRELERSAKG